MKIFNGRIPLLGAVILAAAMLGACSSGGSDTAATNNNQSTASAVKVTAMKGKFAAGSTVIVRRTSDSSEVVRGIIGADGSVSVNIPATATGPFLIEAGIAGDQYFDESTGAMATIPAGGTGLRALITSATASPSVGVTALTEMAVGQIEGASGIAAATTMNVMAANTTVGIQFGVADPLAPPSVIDSGTTVTGTSAADTYALKLAGLAKMANGVPALEAIKAMSLDMADGTLNGQIGTTAVTGLNSYTDIATLTTALNTQVAAATTLYAPGATAPTITITVADLAALLQAAYNVGVAAQTGVTGLSADVLNAQIAATLQTQVQAISTAVAGGSTVAAAEITAIAAATETATTLANATVAGQAFMAAMTTGQYRYTGPNSSGYPVVEKQTATTDAAGKLTFAYNKWALVANVWNGIAASTTDTEWSLSPTGWIGNTTESATVTANADGTITWLNNAGQSGTFLPKVTTLDGTPVDPCVNPSTYVGMIPPTTCTATYPVGSVGYETFGNVRHTDAYFLQQNWSGGINTDANGAELTAMPALGTGFCFNDHYYRPKTPASAGGDNYDVIYSYDSTTGIPACNAANIAVADASTWTNASVLVVSKATGNSVVSSVLHIARAADSSTGSASWLLNGIIGAVSGKVYMGQFIAAGPVPADWNRMSFNKTAMDANMGQFGAPVIPDTWSLPATSGTTTSAAADVAALLADAVAGDMRWWWNNSYITDPVSQVYTNDVHVNFNIPTVSGSTYTFADGSGTKYYSIDNGASWALDTRLNGEYNLLATGWSSANGGVAVDNLDGTITVTPTGQASTVETVTRTDLSGTAIPCEWYAPAACATATYPAGSFSSSSNYTSAVDQYNIRTMIDGLATTVTDASGLQLTSLPATASTMCVSFGRGGQVFVPMATPTATDNHTVYGSLSCSATDITAAMAGTPQGTVFLSLQTTGNASVTNVGLVTVSAANLASLSWLQNRIIGVLNNLVYPGERQPAGLNHHLGGKSKIAIDAELIANGFTASP